MGKRKKVDPPAKAVDWYDPDDPDVPPIWEWLAQQHNNTDPERAGAARYVGERWTFDNYYKHSRVLSVLTAEKSEHLHGVRLLTDDFVELFGIDSREQVHRHHLGVVSPLVPVNREQCSHSFASGKVCTRDAVPGTGKCGNHGGSWITDAERADMVQKISARLVDISERAVTTLADLMDNARSEHVRYESAVAILDRVGVGPIQKIELGVTDAAEDAADRVRGRLIEIAARNGERVVPGEATEVKDETG